MDAGGQRPLPDGAELARGDACRLELEGLRDAELATLLSDSGSGAFGAGSERLASGRERKPACARGACEMRPSTMADPSVPALKLTKPSCMTVVPSARCAPSRTRAASATRTPLGTT